MIGVAPAAPHQLDQERRVTVDAFHAFGQVRDAVIIGAEADIGAARDARDVLDMIGHIGRCNARRRIGGDPGVEARQSGGRIARIEALIALFFARALRAPLAEFALKRTAT